MKILKVLVLFICVSGFAQSKVGTIDVDFIVSKMPELKNVQTVVAQYGKQLDTDLSAKITTYEALIQDYKENETTYTLIQKKEKQDAIVASEQDITKFQQNGAKLIGLKREDQLRPLYEKIGVSVEKIAAEQGFTQLLQITDTVVYLDKNFDVTVAVLSDLGITIKEE
jgi:outer membrane protein